MAALQEAMSPGQLGQPISRTKRWATVGMWECLRGVQAEAFACESKSLDPPRPTGSAERALLSMTVVAQTPCEVLTCTAKQFSHLLRFYPDTLKQLLVALNAT